MSSVRPAYINVYQRILTDNNYTVFNFADCARVNPGKTVYFIAKCPNV